MISYGFMNLSDWFELTEQLGGEKAPPKDQRNVPCDCGAWAELAVFRNGEVEAKCCDCAEREGP